MRKFVLLLVLFFCGVMDLHAQFANRFDIVITEIMADPSPQVGLPNAEFVEIKNVSGHDIDLQNFRLATLSSNSGAFPSYILSAGDFLILSSTSNAAQFATYGQVLGIPGFPSLSNEGTILSITSKEGLTLHAVSYSLLWHQNTIKMDGGWSLEIIDPLNPCTGSTNWSSSVDVNGGTPGKQNSINASNADIAPPQLIRTFSPDSQTIIAIFDEPLDSTTAASVTKYSLQNENILSAEPIPPLFNQVRLTLSTPLEIGTIYTFTVTAVTDCSGNTIGGFNTAKAGILEEAAPTDLVINEILFNPKPNSYDYVELYNRSNKILDASKLYIANRNASGTISSSKKWAEMSYAVFPGEYIVLTEDRLSLEKEYLVKYPENVLHLSSLPSFPDDEGTVVITNVQGTVLDEVRYNKNWHFALISDAEGVALEKVDPNSPSQNKDNWHSAASTVGYGTPTYKNSQYGQPVINASTITLSSKTFSPDNDGLDDLLSIHFNMPQSGFVANVTIFNARGIPVRYLVKNGTMGLKGSWTWDGLDDSNNKLPVGPYIISTELFNLQGHKLQYKNAVVLAARL